MPSLFFFSAYSKRCADKIDFVNTIRNKRGSAKRKLERKLAAKNTVAWKGQRLFFCPRAFFLLSRLLFLASRLFWGELATSFSSSRHIFLFWRLFFWLSVTFFAIGDSTFVSRLYFCTATLFLYSRLYFCIATLFLYSRLYF